MKMETNVLDIIEYIDNQRVFCNFMGADTTVLTLELPDVEVTIKLKFKGNKTK